MDKIEKWFQERLNSPYLNTPKIRIAYEYIKSGDRAKLLQYKNLPQIPTSGRGIH